MIWRYLHFKESSTKKGALCRWEIPILAPQTALEMSTPRWKIEPRRFFQSLAHGALMIPKAGDGVIFFAYNRSNIDLIAEYDNILDL